MQHFFGKLFNCSFVRFESYSSANLSLFVSFSPSEQ